MRYFVVLERNLFSFCRQFLDFGFLTVTSYGTALMEVMDQSIDTPKQRRRLIAAISQDGLAIHPGGDTVVT